MNCDSKMRYQYYCRNCANFKSNTLDKFKEHERLCFNNESVRVEMPKNNQLRFKNLNMTFQHPYFITYEFESTLEEIVTKKGNNTTSYQSHVPNSFTLKFTSTLDKGLSLPIYLFSSPDKDKFINHFINKMKEYLVYAYKISKAEKKIQRENTR